MKLWISFALLLMLDFYSSSVFAEGNCPPGFYPIGGQGAVGCAPVSSPTNATPTATGEWETRWGAFAFDEAKGFMGASSGQESKKKARKEAELECMKVGGIKCKPIFFYKNQCAAIAIGSGSGGYGYSGAPTVEGAKVLAMKACVGTSSGKTCEIIYSACSMSSFRSY
ncbi:DUF4189 domain-containing protein [Xanthomonas campestris pv. incanae]|nr:DUF4189 domain-containing protein [Xanthomonas campestris pv. incanae]